MPTNIKLGPEGGPFVELDEDTGDFIIRVPNDSVDFDLNELSNISNLIANSAEIDGNTSPYAQDPHDVGGAQHAADTLANLNSKVSDATLDDTGDTREPEAHSGTHESGGADEVNVADLSGVLADPQPSQTQDDGTDVVASPTLNFGNGLAVSDDAGTAQVDFDEDDAGVEANIPDWQEDGNSPKTVTNTKNITYTLSDEYDLVLVHFRVSHGEENFNAGVRVNGEDGANYSGFDVRGDFVSDDESFFVAQMSGFGYDGPTSAMFIIQGRSREGKIAITPIGPIGSDTDVLARGECSADVGNTLTDFEILSRVDGDGDVDDITVNVYGRDVE